MAGVKGQKPIVQTGHCWDIKCQIPKEEWKMIRKIADESSVSMSGVMRVAWRRFYSDWMRMSEVERAGVWLKN